MNSYRNGFENRIDPVGFLATEPNLDDALFVLHEQSHSLAPELPLVRRPARFSYHTSGRAGLTVENRDVPLRIRRVLQHLQGSSFGIIARYCATHPCKYLKIKGNVGGESGIRTHGRVSPTHAFQACSFNHSDISPFRINDLRAVQNSVAQNPPSNSSGPQMDCLHRFAELYPAIVSDLLMWRDHLRRFLEASPFPDEPIGGAAFARCVEHDRGRGLDVCN